MQNLERLQEGQSIRVGPKNQDSFKGVHYNQMVNESNHNIEDPSQASDHHFESNNHDHTLESNQITMQVDTNRALQQVNQNEILDISDLKSLDVRRMGSSTAVLTKIGKGEILSKTDEDGEEQKDYYEAHANTEGDLEERFESTFPNRKLGAMTMKPHLPYIKLNIPLGVTSNSVFEIFTTICKQQRFQVIEMDQNIATAVNKEPFSIKKIFMRCNPFADSKKEQEGNLLSAVRLQITVNEIKCCRKVALKGLYGEQIRLQDFLTAFKNRLHDSVVASSNLHGKQPSNHQRRNTAPFIKSLPTVLGKTRVSSGDNDIDDNDEDGEESNQKAYNETSAIYQIHKILSSDQYTLGKNVSEYIDCFHLQYRSLRESASLLPQPMAGVMELVNETVLQFNSEYNLGKHQAKILMSHCRPQVEKYVFSKIYDKLFAMYAIKNEDGDRMFVQRSQDIRNFYRGHQGSQQMLRFLGVNQKFILGQGPNSDQVNESNLNNSQHIEEENDNLRETYSGGRGHHNVIYFEAVRCLEKISSLQSPRDKLQCLSEAFSTLKTIIVEHYKGRIELNAMDDILPLTIYLVANSDITHPVSEHNLMEDFIKAYDSINISGRNFEFEQKLLANFEVSISYISAEWELPSS